MITAEKTAHRIRGLVVGNRSDKTVRVKIERRVRHPLYGKIMRRHRNVQAHDAENVCQMGDQVVLEETPRFSKTKSWRVVEIFPAKEKK
ncbi:MAG: 30S ribosomal protein S17 [Candidatus Zeuxoniibacter abyssi]|nr:MAG: 30S ribosomal protein S17 [Candidatus Persebacteraceae bacterium AB1(2)]